MTNVKNNIRPKHKILGRIYFSAYLIMLVYLLFFARKVLKNKLLWFVP